MAFRLFREFTKLEASAGVFLFATAVIAMIVDNSGFSHAYQNFFNTELSVTIGQIKIAKPLLLWINDGFMSVFFLLVGLEIKRELFEGELNSIARASLPVVAALGGMIAPAAIYLFFNHQDPMAAKGWAIPTATDIAFSLGILSLLGARIPLTLKIFLTALAIFDDIGGISIIAFYYTTQIDVFMVMLAVCLIVILTLMNRFKVSKLGPYFVVGAILWICVLKSGIHATLAGIVLAFAIPLKDPKYSTKSPLRSLERNLHPWVAFGILPLFAFANAGVSFSGITMQHLLQPIPLGIALGLFLGKQIGIWGATMLAVFFRISPLPEDVTPLGLYGVSLIAGVGFTMSLFIGSLAFPAYGQLAAYVRMGVILGSIVSGFLGYVILSRVYPKSKTSHSSTRRTH